MVDMKITYEIMIIPMNVRIDSALPFLNSYYKINNLVIHIDDHNNQIR